MYFSLNEFHLSSGNLPGQEIYPRKYKLLRPGSLERNSSPYTKIGLYRNVIYTYISITYTNVYASPGGGGSYIITTYVIVNGVNQLKELLVFQIFGHVGLKTFGMHVVSYISIRYI